MRLESSRRSHDVLGTDADRSRTRLDGWKQIALYLGRSVRTIQRWERHEQLPVHRHVHAAGATVFAFSDELAEWRRLRSRLFESPADAISSEYATHPDAYALCKLSLEYWAQRTKDGLRKSIALARTAIRRDPGCASAHGVLALAHATRASYGHAAPEEDVRRARQSALHALALDGSVVEAYQALGFVHLCFEWAWGPARMAFERAIQLDPVNPTTFQWFSLWHLVAGSDQRALELARRADELDAHSPILGAHHAWILHQTGHAELAIQKAQAVIRRTPNFWRAYFNLALSLIEVELFEDAVKAVEVASALDESRNLSAVLTHALARGGQIERAKALIASFSTPGGYVSPYWQAYAVMGFGSCDLAVTHLHESIRHREWFLLFLKHEPAFSELRRHSAFVDICRSVNLP